MPGDPPPREDPAAILPAVGVALEPGEELEPTELSAPPRRGGEDIDDDDTSASAVALQPSELAGMFFAILFAILSLFYLFTRLWV
jgi:hypothetical protein